MQSLLDLHMNLHFISMFGSPEYKAKNYLRRSVSEDTHVRVRVWVYLFSSYENKYARSSFCTYVRIAIDYSKILFVRVIFGQII